MQSVETAGLCLSWLRIYQNFLKTQMYSTCLNYIPNVFSLISLLLEYIVNHSGRSIETTNSILKYILKSFSNFGNKNIIVFDIDFVWFKRPRWWTGNIDTFLIIMTVMTGTPNMFEI